MRRRTAVRIAALPFAAGLLVAVGAGPAVSSPLPATHTLAPLDGQPSSPPPTGHAQHDAHAHSTSEPSAGSDALGAHDHHDDHATHGDHVGHDSHAGHGSDDWTKVRPEGTATAPAPADEDCGCGGHDYSAHETGDEHGTGGEHDTTDGHGGHGGAPAEGPSDGTRTAVLGGFGAVNGAALVGAGVLRRRTAGKRERHLAARAAARPAATRPVPGGPAHPTRNDVTGDER